MAGMDHGNERLGVERFDIEFATGDRQPGERQIQIAAPQSVYLRYGTELAKRQMHVGPLLFKSGHDGWENSEFRRGAAAYLELSDFSLGRLLRRSNNFYNLEIIELY